MNLRVGLLRFLFHKIEKLRNSWSHNSLVERYEHSLKAPVGHIIPGIKQAIKAVTLCEVCSSCGNPAEVGTSWNRTTPIRSRKHYFCGRKWIFLYFRSVDCNLFLSHGPLCYVDTSWTTSRLVYCTVKVTIFSYVSSRIHGPLEIPGGPR